MTTYHEAAQAAGFGPNGWRANRGKAEFFRHSQETGESVVETYEATTISLRSRDVGFDLRLQKQAVALPSRRHLIAHTDGKTYVGWSSEVAREMEQDGWRIDWDAVWRG